MARNALDIRANLPSDRELMDMFGSAPKLGQYQVLTSATRAAAKIITARAKQLAPRSTEADRRKRSKKQKASANWNVRLHTQVGMVVRNYDRSSHAVVGPKHPHGNKAYFNAPRAGSRRHVLWGRDTGRTKQAIRNWVVRAFDETRPQQLSAMKTEIGKKINDMLT